MQVAPGTPQNLQVDSTGKATYESPLSDGGARITSYTITVQQGAFVKTFTTVYPDLLFKQLTGLTPGQTYSVSVVATNAAGSLAVPATTTYTEPAVSCELEPSEYVENQVLFFAGYV